jgi:hypothetical protein
MKLQYIKFNADKQQLKTIVANAINASRPMGLGYLSYKKDMTYHQLDFSDEMIFNATGRINIDYFEGRMVKLYIDRFKDDFFILNEIDAEYQSWKNTYETVEHLLKKSGIDDIVLVSELPQMPVV